MSLPPLGLDLAKLKFNARLLRAGGEPRHKVFTNNPDGFARLDGAAVGWLGQGAGAALENRQRAAAQGAPLPGRDGVAL